MFVHRFRFFRTNFQLYRLLLLFFFMSVGLPVSELRPPASVVHPQMIYEYGEPRWNVIDRGERNKSEKNLYRFVHHKSHVG
jgi:hypothetical protein